MDMKLELVIVPVTDVDRAMAFCVDQVAFGLGLTDSEPGSEKGLQLVVDDVVKTHEVLADRGVEVSEVDHQDWGDFIYLADPDGSRHGRGRSGRGSCGRR